MNKAEQGLNRRRFLITTAKLAALGALDPLRDRAGLRKTVLAEGHRLPGDAIYSIHHLSELELQHTYEAMLQDAYINATTEWKIADFDSQAGYWGNGASSGNGGIRTVVSLLLACATLIKYGEDVDQASLAELSGKIQGALRFATATHRTGPAQCPDGRQWGATPAFGPESWQSGMWTGTLAWGSWLIWDQLEVQLRQRLQKVVSWECDILANRLPPNGLWLDTKAEENGWEVPCLVTGALMFPSHPHASDWEQAAYRYMMNTLSTEADTQVTSLSDGRPVKEWIKGANLQPDFTLENHNIFHPSYIGCSCYFLTQAVMYYTYAHHPAPQAATHHLLDTWQMFQTIILPWGEAAYPQGMDWELHGVPFINLYASLGTHWHDSFAAHMEQCTLQYLKAWQAMRQGSLATPGSGLGITRHAINAEQVAYGLLAHKIFGSASPEITSNRAAAMEEGVHDFPYVDFIVHRTMNKFISFSWKNKVMGTLVPIGPDHESNPDFTVPISNGFVGSFELELAGEADSVQRVTVTEHSRRKTSDGFETSGILLRNSGRLKQTVRMRSIGGQTVVYEDLVTALENVTVVSEKGLPFGIENDQITGGVRVATGGSGPIAFDWQKPRKLLNIAGSWVNVAGRLGLVMVGGAGIAYAQAAGYTSGISVCTDILYGSLNEQRRQFKPGEIVARRVAIVYVEVTPAETASLAALSAIGGQADTQTLRIKQPGGRFAVVPLLASPYQK